MDVFLLIVHAQFLREAAFLPSSINIIVTALLLLDTSLTYAVTITLILRLQFRCQVYCSFYLDIYFDFCCNVAIAVLLIYR